MERVSPYTRGNFFLVHVNFVFWPHRPAHTGHSECTCLRARKSLDHHLARVGAHRPFGLLRPPGDLTDHSCKGLRIEKTARTYQTSETKSADPLVGSPGVGDCSSPLPPPLWTDVDHFAWGGAQRESGRCQIAFNSAERRFLPPSN